MNTQPKPLRLAEELLKTDTRSSRWEAADELCRLHELNQEWERKAAIWLASPEAAQRLDGYRELAQRVNQLEMLKQEPVECQYGNGGYACCEGGPCKADEQNTAAPVQEPDARIAELEETVRQLNHALREATEAPTFMGEPVIAKPAAKIKGVDEYGPMLDWFKHWINFPVGTKLYTTPPTAQRPWVGLSDEEIDKTYETQVWDARRSYARAIEAKLKEMNAPEQPGVAKAA